VLGLAKPDLLISNGAEFAGCGTKAVAVAIAIKIALIYDALDPAPVPTKNPIRFDEVRHPAGF
jgi:hypothetical protein